MRNRFWSGLLCGIALGIVGAVAVDRLGDQPVQLNFAFPSAGPANESWPGGPQVPPNYNRQELIGDKSPTMPLPGTT
jgi:hypothetical protein